MRARALGGTSPQGDRPHLGDDHVGDNPHAINLWNVNLDNPDDPHLLDDFDNLDEPNDLDGPWM